MAKSNDSDVLQLLDSLDAAPVLPSKKEQQKAPVSSTTAGTPGGTGEAAEALAFLDELTQKSNRPTRVLTPGPRVRNPATEGVRKSTDSTRNSPVAPTPPRSGTPSVPAASSTSTNTTVSPSAGGVGWGWGSVWSTATMIASQAAAQAKTVVDEQVKHLPANDQAKKWGEGVMEYVKNAQLDKLSNDIRKVGISTLTDIMNAVAPPIAEHEVIQVWLSHDMKGYEGVESLVYRAFARIMEQVEGGDLVVNRGNETKPKEDLVDSEQRNISAIEGLEAALKLAAADLESLVKSDKVKAAEEKNAAVDKNTNPTTYSFVFLRVQPFLSNPFPPTTATDGSTIDSPQQLQFLLYLNDPQHSITHTTVTQTVPATWLDIWDEYDWVEDLVVDVLRVGVEIIGEQYLASRMNWGKKSEIPTITTNAPLDEKAAKLDAGKRQSSWIVVDQH